MRQSILCLGAALALAGPAAAAGPADPASVIAAERAFSARAGQVGVSASFLEFMADDAVVFAPGPVGAKAFFLAQPPDKAPKDGGTRLAWWPNFAGVARSGDLGFTTGPASENGAAPGVFYFTVWKKQPDGGWKWVFDGGVKADGANAPGPEQAPRTLATSAATGPAGAGQGWTWEDAFHVAAQVDLRGAYAKALTPDAYVQGKGHTPVADAGAVRNLVATRPAAMAFERLGGGISQARDLAWSYGTARWDGGQGHYVRVWQARPEGWKIVFDELAG
jgi:hypothetical protein